MATLDDVRRLALALPETTEEARHGDTRAWQVAKKQFVWERPLHKSDLAALASLGEPAPTGIVLGAHVPDEGAKYALVAAEPDVYFTVPHFNGYAAVLVRLETIGIDDLDELIGEAWFCRAPAKVRAAYPNLADDR